MSGEPEPIAAAAPLLAEAGLPASRSVARLAGGKNNRVYLLTLADGSDCVLKAYFRDARDPRDRLGAEWRFLSYARARGIGAVPAPLAKDDSAGVALYTRLSGAKLDPGGVTPGLVEAAAAFVVDLNRPPRDASGLAPASEACFSLAEHVAAVERRVARLRTLDAEAPHRADAERLVVETLAPLWTRVRARIEDFAGSAGIRLDEPLPADGRIVSPSDFGFHNALVQDGRAGFLDFEYAGLDDPAKLVGDFYSVPEIPTPDATFDGFVGRLARDLSLGGGFVARARALLGAYRVKWACIILNDFLPGDAARRGFALAGDRAARCRAQLDKARARLARIDPDADR